MPVNLEIERSDHTLSLKEEICTATDQNGTKYSFCWLIGGIGGVVMITRKDGAFSSYIFNLRDVFTKIADNSVEWDKTKKIGRKKADA